MKRLRLVINGATVRAQPPIVGDFCKTPDTKNVDKPCGYEADTCDGQASACQRCGFSYCSNHQPAHIRKLPPMPRDVWLRTIRHFHQALNHIGKHPRSPFPPVDLAYAPDDK